MKNLLVGLLIFVTIAYGVPYTIDAIQTKRAVDEVTAGANDPKSEAVISEAEAYKHFMGSCDSGESDGAGFDQTAYCECTFDMVVREWGINKMVHMGLNYTADEIQVEIEPFINACVAEQEV